MKVKSLRFRLLALILASLMAFGSIDISAFADTTPAATEQSEGQAVSQTEETAPKKNILQKVGDWFAKGKEKIAGIFNSIKGFAGSLFDAIKLNISDKSQHPVNMWYNEDTEYKAPEDLDESFSMLIDIIDEAAQKAYNYNLDQVSKAAEEAGVDVGLSTSNYQRMGNVNKNIDYAYVMAVYSLKYTMEATDLASFQKAMDEAVPKMQTLQLNAAITHTVTPKEQYVYEPVDVTVCHWEEHSSTDEDGNVDTWIEHHDPDVSLPRSEGTSVKWDVDVEDGKYISGTHDKTQEQEIIVDGNGNPVSDQYYQIALDENGNPKKFSPITNEEGRLVPNFVQANPLDEENCGNFYHSSMNDRTYYKLSSEGEEPYKRRDKPEVKDVQTLDTYAEAFKNSDLWEIFDIDPDAKYVADYSGKLEVTKGNIGYGLANIPDYSITNLEMASLRYEQYKELFSAAIATQSRSYYTGLTLEEIQDYLDELDSSISLNRKQVIKVALTGVNQIPYCNNGEQSKPTMTGYDPSWYDYTRTDAYGRPSGLDSSGFVQWVFWTAGFTQEEVANLKTASLISNKVQELADHDKIKPGDIGLVQLGISDNGTESVNRVGIYLGKSRWIIMSGETNTVSITTFKDSSETFKSIKVFSPRMEDDDLWTDSITLCVGATQAGGDMIDICAVILQESYDPKQDFLGSFAVAECIKNRAVSTDPDWANVNTMWDVITQKNQFEAYGSGAYVGRRTQVTSYILDRVQQIIDGQYTVLNNPYVFFFVSISYHESHYKVKADCWLNKYEVFGNYGTREDQSCNVFYIESQYLKMTGTTGLNVYGMGEAGKSAANCTVPDNKSNHKIKLYLQGQGAWASMAYGEGTISGRGCGICATAMAINYCLYGSDGNYNPADVLALVGDKYSVPGHGSAHTLPSGVASLHGLQSEYNAGCPSVSYEQTALNKFKSGWVAVCSMGKGYFTNGGHFIVLSGCDEKGNIYVVDSSSGERSTRGYSWAFLVNKATKHGANGAWANYEGSDGGSMTSITWIKANISE